jgi:hypothetical protein
MVVFSFTSSISDNQSIKPISLPPFLIHKSILHHQKSVPAKQSNPSSQQQQITEPITTPPSLEACGGYGFTKLKPLPPPLLFRQNTSHNYRHPQSQPTSLHQNYLQFYKLKSINNGFNS